MVDPVDRTVSATVSLPPASGISFEAAQVAVGLGRAWFLTGDCVCRIDPETHEVDQIRIPFPGQFALGHRAAWVATLGPEIYPIEAAADEASDPISLPVRQVFHASVGTTEDAVWVAFNRQLARIDPVEGTIGKPIAAGHGADDIIGEKGGFWVVDRLARILYRYDLAGRQVDSVPLQFTPDHVVVGPDGDVWVLDRSGETVTVVRPDGEVGQAISVGEDPSDLAVGPDAIWVADREGRSIQRIDPVLKRKDDPIRLPGPVAAIGVDPDTDQVWAYLH
jgi:streptogramin lyase